MVSFNVYARFTLKGTTKEAALYDLEQTIKLARVSKERVVCIIVGYGSKGGTHKIKSNIIGVLEEKKSNNQIKDYICGSDLDLFNSKYLNLKYKELIPDECKKRRNPGEIIIIL